MDLSLDEVIKGSKKLGGNSKAGAKGGGKSARSGRARQRETKRGGGGGGGAQQGQKKANVKNLQNRKSKRDGAGRGRGGRGGKSEKPKAAGAPKVAAPSGEEKLAMALDDVIKTLPGRRKGGGKGQTEEKTGRRGKRGGKRNLVALKKDGFAGKVKAKNLKKKAEAKAAARIGGAAQATSAGTRRRARGGRGRTGQAAAAAAYYYEDVQWQRRGRGGMSAWEDDYYYGPPSRGWGAPPPAVGRRGAWAAGGHLEDWDRRPVKGAKSAPIRESRYAAPRRSQEGGFRLRERVRDELTPKRRLGFGYGAASVRQALSTGIGRSAGLAPRSAAARSAGNQGGRNTRICVHPVPRGLRSADIQEAFEDLGKVLSCKIERGDAWIVFDKALDAKKAVQTFDRGELNGQTIYVTIE